MPHGHEDMRRPCPAQHGRRGGGDALKLARAGILCGPLLWRTLYISGRLGTSGVVIPDGVSETCNFGYLNVTLFLIDVVFNKRNVLCGLGNLFFGWRVGIVGRVCVVVLKRVLVVFLVVFFIVLGVFSIFGLGEGKMGLNPNRKES